MIENASMLGKDQTLFGVVALPEQSDTKIGVIILNAGLLHNVGPFRLHVDLARHLAKNGIPSVRIDQSGKGESERRSGGGRQETMLDDYDEALSALSDAGVEKSVLVGLCSGADDALYLSTCRDSIVGLVQLDGYARRGVSYRINHYLPRLLSPGAWFHIVVRATHRSNSSLSSRTMVDDFDIRDWPSDAEMISRFESFLKRDGQALAVFTGGQDYYNAKGQLAALLTKSSKLGNLGEIYYPKSDHTYSLPRYRAELVSAVADWIKATFSDAK